MRSARTTTLHFVGANLTITPRPMTVTADGQSKVYGDADPALTYQITSGTVVRRRFSGALTRMAGEDVGSYADPAGLTCAERELRAVFVGANLTITPRPITVTAEVRRRSTATRTRPLTYQSPPAAWW